MSCCPLIFYLLEKSNPIKCCFCLSEIAITTAGPEKKKKIWRKGLDIFSCTSFRFDSLSIISNIIAARDGVVIYLEIKLSLENHFSAKLSNTLKTTTLALALNKSPNLGIY